MKSTNVPTAARAFLRSDCGRVLDLPSHRWLSAADAVDELALNRALGPALDVGCGPGRHVEALTARAIATLGIDISSEFVAVAQARGLNVRHRCVFDWLPLRTWRTILLLDGNIGIGGDPALLLRRVEQLLAANGRVIVELTTDASPTRVTRVRTEVDGIAGPWFAWATVALGCLRNATATTNLVVTDEWQTNDRTFAMLELAPERI